MTTTLWDFGSEVSCCQVREFKYLGVFFRTLSQISDSICEKSFAWRHRLTISKQSRKLVDLSAKQVPAQGGRERLMSYLPHTTHNEKDRELWMFFLCVVAAQIEGFLHFLVSLWHTECTCCYVCLNVLLILTVKLVLTQPSHDECFYACLQNFLTIKLQEIGKLITLYTWLKLFRNRCRQKGTVQ